jgi:hypothetical protein
MRFLLGERFNDYRYAGALDVSNEFFQFCHQEAFFDLA